MVQEIKQILQKSTDSDEGCARRFNFNDNRDKGMDI